MCGIAGFVLGPNLSGDRGTLSAMLGRIHHRGPDADGEWNEENIWLGHKRLAIVDVTSSGAQPMLSQSGRYVISYNGEIYNFRELRTELESGGSIAWRGSSDTEVLIELISRVGLKQALLRINGMFAFALWDRTEKKLSLARDRFGEKPLYYAEKGGGLAFASELTAIESIKGLPQEIDHDVIVTFLQNGYVPSPLSIYHGVRKLPPASFITFSSGVVSSVETYWSLSEVAQRGIQNPINDEREVVDSLEAELERSCREKMISDVPLGAFLSGGIDSSTVVALMQKHSSRPIKTYTIGFDIPNLNEAPFAKAVAQYLGTDHTEQIVTSQEAIDIAPRLGAIYDEPFADPSAIPTYLISRLARSQVTVSLSGDGGDELFGGYRRYFLLPDLWRRIHWMPMRRTVGSAIRMIPSYVLDRVLAPLKSYESRFGTTGNTIGVKAHRFAEHLGMANFEDFYLSAMISIPDAAEFVKGARRCRAAPVDANLDLHSQLNWMSFMDSITYLPNNILTKVDRAAMAVSLEGRMPFLDPAVAEIAWRTPSRLKILDGVGKWPLRQVLYRHVPKHLFDRPKMGFGIPLREWLNGPLRPWASDLLSEERIRRQGILDVGRTRACLDSFMNGQRPEPIKLWTLLMFQSWLEARGR